MRILLECSNGYTLVSLGMDAFCFVTGKVPNQSINEGLVAVSDKTPGKSRKVFANTDLVMVVKDLHLSGKGCRDITFIRRNRYNNSNLKFIGPCDLAKAELDRIVPLLRQDESMTHYQALEGFCGGVIYPDEVAIPDPSSPTGVIGWILLKTKFKQLLENPPKDVIKTTTVKPDIDPVAEAEKAAAKALAHLESVRQAVALKALVDEAATKRATATEAKSAADKADADVAEARKVLSDKKAVAKIAAEAAITAEEAAVAAEEAAITAEEDAKTVTVAA